MLILIILIILLIVIIFREKLSGKTDVSTEAQAHSSVTEDTDPEWYNPTHYDVVVKYIQPTLGDYTDLLVWIALILLVIWIISNLMDLKSISNLFKNINMGFWGFVLLLYVGGMAIYIALDKYEKMPNFDDWKFSSSPITVALHDVHKSKTERLDPFTEVSLIIPKTITPGATTVNTVCAEIVDQNLLTKELGEEKHIVKIGNNGTKIFVGLSNKAKQLMVQNNISSVYVKFTLHTKQRGTNICSHS